MNRRYHFISGLPRSGSTLLAAILSQNPRFQAGMSGPLGSLFSGLLGQMSGSNEFSVFLTDTQRQRILRGMFDNYYADSNAEVVFDTNRSWCTRLPALATLFPEAKVIACVRDVSWILDSIERLVRANAFQPSSIFNYTPNGTVYTRANGLAGPEGMVGYAYDALKEAYFGEHAAGRLILVRYESLVADPERVVRQIYDLLGEAWYPHDFANITFDAEEFDRRAGTPGLHTVRAQVSARVRQTILPPDLFQRFQRDNFWCDQEYRREGVSVL